MVSTIDHLIVAATTLEEGAQFVQKALGVAPQPGGKHERMGTHNCLLKLGPELYLEIIAIDPQAAAPSRPRWFDLDLPGMRAQLQAGPRLITWVARTGNIEQLATGSSEPLGPIHRMRRGGFAWKITIPDDGHLPGGGLVPTLIEWQGKRHPADGLADSGCSLQALGGAHGEPDRMRRALASLDLAGSLPVTYGAGPRLLARIATPFGVRTLSS